VIEMSSMSSPTPSTSPLAALADALAAGAVRVVDLTQPLSESTPVLRLPEPFANTPGLTRHELSRYDERGPAWAWSWLDIGKHVGTHFDAPIHWITGKDGEDVASVPAARLVGPAIVIDKSAEAAADPDWCLSVAGVRAFESEHGALPAGGCCSCAPAGTRARTTRRRS
jgi:kynurenine formamidase